MERKPTLVGYYRLLLGVPQKSFYGSESGMRRFRSMEMSDTLTLRQREGLNLFCKAMCTSLAELVRQISPAVTSRDVAELPLLTIGSQFQGANNNLIGQQATVDVFLAIGEIVSACLIERGEKVLTLKNASGRVVKIALASDPDVRIQEEFGSESRKKVAIEIKGGTDVSNAHNRAGEAEKSHQKAKNEGFRDFWTVIAMKGLDRRKLRAESPTTTSWFDAAQIIGQTGSQWEEFRSRVADVVGIPLKA